VLAPISWELIEPREGEFDFSSLEALVEDARAHDMRLVLLWFGLWKTRCQATHPLG
jgi:GH35 family endo-1,4-beta-xylanase